MNTLVVYYTRFGNTQRVAETVAEEDRWPLVHYVRSLQRQPGFFERLVFEFP